MLSSACAAPLSCRRPPSNRLHCLSTISSPFFVPSLVHTILCTTMLCCLSTAVMCAGISVPIIMPPPSSSFVPGNFYRTVCAFPSLHDSNGCQRGGLGSDLGGDGDEEELLNGWFCDPGSTISMSEVVVIDGTLKRIYEQHRHQCVCGDAEENVKKLEIVADHSAPQTMPSSNICWFRFGFAVVPELSPGTDSASAEHCANNFDDNDEEGTANSTEESNGQLAFIRHSRFIPSENGNLFDTFTAFAQNYAQVLRQRWQLGTCGEDILILIVQRAPQKLSTEPLSSAHSRLFGSLPLLFLSLGPLFTHRLPPDFANAIQHILHDANAQLQHDARPLFKVLSELLLRMDAEVLGALGHELSGGGGDYDGTRRRHLPSSAAALTHAQHRHSYYADGSPPISRSHIPPWAWIVFGVCGIAFALMGLGLFLIRTRTRRGGTALASLKKQQYNTSLMASSNRRHWKESSQFGKEEQPPPPTTYVNLVQLLMPHPKASTANMAQQV